MALLFDFKTFKSPWLKAMQCRAEKIWKNPFDIKLSFNNALGPVFVPGGNSMKEIIENQVTQSFS